MCPVHQAAQIVPFVHATNVYPVAHTEGNTFGKVNIVSYQQRPAGAYIQYESLVPRAIVVIRQQAIDEPADLDPRTRVTFVQCGVQAMSDSEKLRQPFPGRRCLLRADRLSGGNRHHRNFNASVCLATISRRVIRYRTRLTHADCNETLRHHVPPLQVSGY